MRRYLIQTFAALLLVFSLATVAMAQDYPGPGPDTRGPMPAPTNVNITTTTVNTTTGITSGDAELASDLAALGVVWSKYDRQILAVCNRDQAINFQAMILGGDSNTFYWFKNALTQDNVHAYVAYLSQRLHLDPVQEEQVSWIERHMMAEAGPLWVAYMNRLAALQQLAVVRTNVQVTPPISTAPEPAPPPTVETPPPAPAPRTEVKSNTTPPKKVFIRNRDRK